jgi:hypothetical protein
MSLMAWFRKHNRKLMAVVVIGLMIVFTIGPLMDYLRWRRAGGHKVVAFYDDGKKISTKDLFWAQKQLALMNLAGVGSLLRPLDPQTAPMQDLRLALLGELLFAERSTGAETVSRIRQIVGNMGYRISDGQINDIYTKAYPADVYWLLLSKEAQMAGVRVPLDMAKLQLEAIIPHMGERLTYSDFVAWIVSRQQVSEKELLGTFAELMAVVEYGKMMCSTQNITAQQMLYEAHRREETLDVNCVVFEAKMFAEESSQPSEKEINEHFEKYKGFFPGEVSEQNPYGFGYKLLERVQLEYMAVRLDDVAATVPKLTQQEMEDYYQQHSSQPPITYAVPSDPNDPNSPMTTRVRSYAEVATALSKMLYQQRVDSKAEQLLFDAESITEANMVGIDNEQTGPTEEQIKQRAGDYEKTAAELGEKYKVEVYTGKTGLLSAVDMQADEDLGSLYLEGTGFASIGLVRVAFAVEPLKASELGPFDARPYRLYENIGPLKDIFERIQGYSGKNMMLVRVIRAEKAAEPNSVNDKIDKHGVQFDRQSEIADDVNLVREIVVEDLKRLAAMNVAKDKAEQFAQLALKEGWDAAISRFNELYGDSAEKSEDDANALSDVQKSFALRTRTGLQRIPDTGVANLEVRYEGDPTATSMLNRIKAEKKFAEMFYALVPEDSNTLAAPGTIVEFKPGFSYYCVESLTIHRLYKEQFDRIKAAAIVRDDFASSQALAAAHYSPQNILKRMNFSLAKEPKETTPSGSADEANAPGSAPN